MHSTLYVSLDLIYPCHCFAFGAILPRFKRRTSITDVAAERENLGISCLLVGATKGPLGRYRARSMSQVGLGVGRGEE